jgi:hypothetical protein
VNKFFFTNFCIVNCFFKIFLIMPRPQIKGSLKRMTRTTPFLFYLSTPGIPIRYIPRIFNIAVTRSFGFHSFSQLWRFSVSQSCYRGIKRELRPPDFQLSNQNCLNSDKTLRSAPFHMFSRHQGFLHHMKFTILSPK